MWCFDCSIKNAKKHKQSRANNLPMMTLKAKWEETKSDLQRDGGGSGGGAAGGTSTIAPVGEGKRAATCTDRTCSPMALIGCFVAIFYFYPSALSGGTKHSIRVLSSQHGTLFVVCEHVLCFMLTCAR